MTKAVFLIGFMGSGKTTIGKKLAAKLKAKFVDLDELVCMETEFPTVKDLIESKGFDFFRQVESDVLKTILPEEKVISTGGGTPCFFDNMEWMKARGVVVFLNVEEGVLYSRLANTDLEERPMLKSLNADDLKLFIRGKLAERLPYYEQAHIRFDPVKENLEQLAKGILHYTHPSE